MAKGLTSQQVKDGLAAMTPEARAHIAMKAAMMKPTTVDSIIKRQDGAGPIKLKRGKVI